MHIGLRPSRALNTRPLDLARFGQMLLGSGSRGDTTLFARGPARRYVLSGAGSVVDGNLRHISALSAWGRWVTTGLSLVLLLGLALQNPIVWFGTPTLFSLGYAGLFLLYAAAVLAGRWGLVRSRNRVHAGT